jgi:chromosome segregation ATPase
MEQEARHLRGQNSSALTNIKTRLSSISDEKSRLENELRQSRLAKEDADSKLTQATALVERFRAASAEDKQKLALSTRQIEALRLQVGQAGDTQVQIQELQGQLRQALADAARSISEKGKSNVKAAELEKRAGSLQIKYENLVTSQQRVTSNLEVKLREAEASISQLSASVQASGRNSDQLRYAEQELQQLRLESQQLKLALRDCGAQDHRLDLTDQLNTGRKKELPSYMRPTESKISRNSVTQKQLDARGTGRYARGGKKGARMTKAKKRIAPLE